MQYKLDNNNPQFDLELSYVVRAFHLHYSHVENDQTWDNWTETDNARLSDLIEQSNGNSGEFAVDII